MEQLNQITALIALSMGAAWASGINLYAAVLMLGLLGSSGHLALPADLQILTHPLVLFAAGAMYLLEFTADKIPGVDNSWDALHSFIRIPAGAVLAAAAVGELDPAFSLAAALFGGSLAAATHATKAGSRVLINTSPEPLTNWTASLTEDALVVVGLWAALYHPWVFLVMLICFILAMIWLLPKLWYGLRQMFRALRRLFSGVAPDPFPRPVAEAAISKQLPLSADRSGGDDG